MSIDFLGIGAQKAGTSWIYHHLRLHPQIRFPGGKEIHYWDQQYPKGLESYQALFPNHRENLKYGEITPAYAILPRETVNRIYQTAPQANVFFIIRNPIDRAWSSALMALARAEMTVNEASDQWFIDHFQSQGSRLRGDYQRTLDIWRNIYPEKQFLLLSFEDIVNKPEKLLETLCKFIGADGTYFGDNPALISREKVFANHSYPIRPSLRTALETIYPHTKS